MSNGEFESIIGYSFKNKNLLKIALTHSSYCREHGLGHEDNNERLEFLGDAFLDAIVGATLYDILNNKPEGALTKTRALIVCEKSLADAGMKIHIGDFLNMGKGEEQNGGRQRPSIIADAVEAVIGAMYVDGGYETTCTFVNHLLRQTIQDALAGKLFTDYKTKIQEKLQEKGKSVNICYVIDREEGPAHDKTFYVHLECNGKSLEHGSGKSKKEAEQNAAKATMEKGVADVF